LPALFSLANTKNRVAFGDMLAAIHRLLRREYERRRARIATSALITNAMNSFDRDVGAADNAFPALTFRVDEFRRVGAASATRVSCSARKCASI